MGLAIASVLSPGSVRAEAEPGAPGSAAAGPRWIGADVPSRGNDVPPWRAHGLAVAVVAGCTVVGRYLYGRLDDPNLMMLFLLGIVVVALRGDRLAALGAAVLGVAAFDFFFVVPYYSFTVRDTQYVVTLLVMGLVSVVISSLTSRLVAEVAATRERARRAQALYMLSRSLLGARSPAEVLAEGARVIAAELGSPVGAWERGAQGEAIAAVPGVTAMNPSEAELLRWTLHDGHVAGRGTDVLPGAGFLFVPVRTPAGVHGALGIRVPEGAAGPAEEVRATLETGANQIAVALEHARAREEAQRAEALAEAERLRNALLSAVSHDLRTPLAGIVGSASALVDGAEALAPEVRQDLAQGIVEEAERLNRLVTNLLQATRLDAGGPALHRTWLSLDEVVAPAIARLAAPLSDHRVVVALPAELPLVHGDAALLEQAFVNLFENAARHTPPGTTIQVSGRAAGDRLLIEVADDGPGLPPGQEMAVFERFRSFPRRGGDPSTGLGLAIVRGVVTAHGGTISAENRPSGGTAFLIGLPLVEQGDDGR